eukprot:243899_1
MGDISTNITVPEFTLTYCFYIFLIIWDGLLIFSFMIFFRHRWNLYEIKEIPKYDDSEHVFVIACHNSSDVIYNTLKSLIEKVKPQNIYVADNGSSEEEQQLTNDICHQLTREYYKLNNELVYNPKLVINYGHSYIGNKTIAQYCSICNLPPHVKYVTCIDDDTRLHETWQVDKVIDYFENDSNIGVLAYPLRAEQPEFDIELFQALEYLIVGFVKICHSTIYSTIFNSGAFGTYKVEILRESFQYHNTDFHGDDLQICLNMHQLKGKKYITKENKIHVTNYKVMTATNMIVSTIVPKCWIHLRSVSRKLFPSVCDCNNPDLFGQRSKGWFVSKHRFIPKYLKFIFNCNGWKGIWVRLITAYDLLMILNEYFAIFYIAFFLKYLNIWLLEGFIIGTAWNIFVMILFNYYVLKRNKLNLPIEAITLQPIIYKVFMITLYRYAGLFYNLFVYTLTHKSGTLIRKRMENENFLQLIKTMYKNKKVRNNMMTQELVIPVQIHERIYTNEMNNMKRQIMDQLKEEIRVAMLNEMGQMISISDNDHESGMSIIRESEEMDAKEFEVMTINSASASISSQLGISLKGVKSKSSNYDYPTKSNSLSPVVSKSPVSRHSVSKSEHNYTIKIDTIDEDDV